MSAVGSDPQRAAVAEMRAAQGQGGQRFERANALRLAVEQDAVALALALGDDRVGHILARKDELSTAFGEGRAWDAAIDRLETP